MKITIEVFEDVADQLQALKSPQKYSTFSKWLESPNAYYTPVTVAVAREKDEVAGWSGVGTTRGRRRDPVVGVFVDPKYRSQGLGEKLVREAVRAYISETKEDWGDMKPIILFDRSSWPMLEKILEEEGVNPFNIDDVIEKGSRA